MDYPTFYASSKAGWLTTDVEVAKSISRNEVSKQQYGMEELLDAILDYLNEDGQKIEPEYYADSEIGMVDRIWIF